MNTEIQFFNSLQFGQLRGMNINGEAWLMATDVARLAPKAEYAEEVLMSPTCYTMTQVAKSLSMTVQQLQHWLHKMRIIYRSPSGPWMLYAEYLKKGYEAYRTKKGDTSSAKCSGRTLIWCGRSEAKSSSTTYSARWLLRLYDNDDDTLRYDDKISINHKL